jgi:hypothetical protein
MQSLWGCAYEIRSLGQGGETGIGKMAAEKVCVPPAGREAKGGILNRPRRQMSFLSFSDSCELAPLRVCELASILCVSFWVMPRMLGNVIRFCSHYKKFHFPFFLQPTVHILYYV